MNDRKQGTKAAWGGQSELFYQGSTEVAIVNSVTFGYDNLDDWADVASGKKDGHIYSRSTNPTVGDFDNVKVFLNSLELAHLAASLGSVSTLIGPPKATSHSPILATL